MLPVSPNVLKVIGPAVDRTSRTSFDRVGTSSNRWGPASGGPWFVTTPPGWRGGTRGRRLRTGAVAGAEVQVVRTSIRSSSGSASSGSSVPVDR